MKLITAEAHIVSISLSRRNLVALLDALDDPYAPGANLRKRTEDGLVLNVRADEDDDHYADEAQRERQQITDRLAWLRQHPWACGTEGEADCLIDRLEQIECERGG